MAQRQLTHGQFFTQLATLLESRQQQGHGSVWLTQKRLSHDTFPTPSAQKIADDPLWDTHPPHPLPLLIRATDGASRGKDRKKSSGGNSSSKKVKLSTVVQPDELEGFYVRYAEVCKAGMGALRKRDRSKRKKAKGKKKDA